MFATLEERGWLCRKLAFTREDGTTIEIKYSGRGLGKETVTVEDVECVMTSVLWYAPVFNLQHLSDQYVVRIKVWPWMMIRSMEVERNGEVIYKED